jgi:hypothetical protein
MIEAHLINPLARALFDGEVEGPTRVTSVIAGTVTALELDDA